MSAGGMTGSVSTAAIREAIAGRESLVLDGLGINWRTGRPHITCPYPGHGGAADWRWDVKAAKARCTCAPGDSILDVIMKVEAIDFEAAKVRAAELIGRTDLIRNGNGHYQATDAASLLSAPADRRDDALPLAYLAHRLGVAVDAVPIPSTPIVGLKALGYYDPPPPGSQAKPKLVRRIPVRRVWDGCRRRADACPSHLSGPGRRGKGRSRHWPGRPAARSEEVCEVHRRRQHGRAVGHLGRCDPCLSHRRCRRHRDGRSRGAGPDTPKSRPGRRRLQQRLRRLASKRSSRIPATRRVTIAADRDEAPRLTASQVHDEASKRLANSAGAITRPSKLPSRYPAIRARAPTGSTCFAAKAPMPCAPASWHRPKRTPAVGGAMAPLRHRSKTQRKFRHRRNRTTRRHWPKKPSMASPANWFGRSSRTVRPIRRHLDPVPGLRRQRHWAWSALSH